METGIVSTIRDKCKRCYSCIRECPALAIRVEGGQAVVIPERCIACGHCVKVCSQYAKQVESDVNYIFNELIPTGKVIATVAPSLAAAFSDSYDVIPTVLRKLGFTKVIETAFGADLVSQEYIKYLSENPDKTIISTPCPAIYNFVEKYYMELVDNLAKVVSPMIAIGRYIKKNFGEDYKVVFIGPCVAKKSESKDKPVEGVIDAVMTFTELKKFFKEKNINLKDFEVSDFDPPHSNFGKSYPLSGGLLKTSEIDSDILHQEIIVVDGKNKVKDIIEDIANHKINAKFIDILFCEGCINGPAVDSGLNYYSKREKMIEYITKRNNNLDKGVWKGEIFNSRNLDLRRDFIPDNQRKEMPSEETIRQILAKTNKSKKEDELNCGACGYKTCREYAISIAKGLGEEEMCLPYLIDKLEGALKSLKDTQEQLQHVEKLASIGQLAAGVAHEMNNPLGTILLYSSLLSQEIEEKLGTTQSVEDLKTIIEETNRCRNIVSNLLNFARQGKLKLSKVKINNVLQDIIKTLNLKYKNSGILINLNSNDKQFIIDADRDQIKQVFLNIMNNACEALEESVDKRIDIYLYEKDNNLVVEVKDTGCGIPEENIKKLFTPFFTTKKMGQGTGLGLAITYGIIKMHKGDIRVQSELNKGSNFIITLPKEINTNYF